MDDKIFYVVNKQKPFEEKRNKVMAQTNNTTATTFTSDAAIIIPGTENLRTSGTNIVTARNLIIGTENPDILFGTPGDDEIRGLGGDDTIIGTTGNDLIDGGSGFDTLDYSNLGQAITLLPRGVIGEGSGSGGQIFSIAKIIGAKGQKNSIDGSGGTGGASFDINLEANQLVVNNIPNLGSIKFGVENFVNVTGTSNQDSIFGNSSNNVLNGLGGDDFLSGGLGNDTLLGGDGNDTLQGSTNVGNSRSPERDTLTGGAGVDKFILGDASGSFYTKAGNQDFAKITDFTFGEQIQLGAGNVYNIQRNKSGFNISVVKDSVQDLIAQVTVVTGTANPKTSLAGGLTDFTSNALASTLPSGDFTLSPGQSISGLVGA